MEEDKKESESPLSMGGAELSGLINSECHFIFYILYAEPETMYGCVLLLCGLIVGS